jgi:hypothetical protein
VRREVLVRRVVLADALGRQQAEELDQHRVGLVVAEHGHERVQEVQVLALGGAGVDALVAILQHGQQQLALAREVMQQPRLADADRRGQLRVGRGIEPALGEHPRGGVEDLASPSLSARARACLAPGHGAKRYRKVVDRSADSRFP